MTHRRTLVAVAIAFAAVIAGASSLRAGGERGKPVKPRDVTLVGKIVDLQSFMTGKFANSDPVRGTQDCIRQGVPAALETEEGLVVIGMGERGPSRTLLPLALKQVEVKGKLYEKDGVQYIDMASATLVKEEVKEEPEHEAEEEEAEEEHGDEEEPEVEP